MNEAPFSDSTHDSFTLSDALSAMRRGAQSTPIIEVSSDPRDALAYALSIIRGDDDGAISKTDTIDQMRARIERMHQMDSKEAITELSSHLPILEHQWLRYSVESVRSKRTDDRVRLAKLGIVCQSAYARTLALVVTLRAQLQNGGRVVVHDDDGDAE